MRESLSANIECKKKHPRSLQKFLILVVFMAIIIPAVIAGGVLINSNLERATQKSESIAENYADLLMAGMKRPLWTLSPSAGKPFIDGISLNPSVRKIVVLDSDNRVFLHYESVLPVNGDRENFVVTRVIQYENEIIGKIELFYTPQLDLDESLYELWRLFVIIAIQLFFSLIFISYFLRHKVVKPLIDLEEAAAGIASGDLKTSIPLLGEDEFGALSHQLEKMRSSLASSFTTLEERVRDRTADLIDLNKELKQALDQLKVAQGSLVQSEKLAALGSLVAGVSHELNTPIGNGLTVASSLMDSTNRFKKKMSEGVTRNEFDQFLCDMEEGCRLVVSSLEKGSELVSSFKQVSVDRASENRRFFSLKEMLTEIKLTNSPMFRHTPYQIIINIKDAIQVNSYPGPLGQVVTNLMNNALIHGFDGRETGTITISAEYDEETDKVSLSVSDDGNGIPEKHRFRIYDPFFTTKLGEGGNGLGMHIVHNIVTGVLGGDITLASEEGQGTTFTLVFPRTAPSESDLLEDDGGFDDSIADFSDEELNGNSDYDDD